MKCADRKYLLKEAQRTLDESDSTAAFCLCQRWILKDALALLKEQETTFMKDGHHIMCKSCGAYWCDRDREGDQYPQNFCPNCGKKDGGQMKRQKETFWDSLSEADLMEPMHHFED